MTGVLAARLLTLWGALAAAATALAVWSVAMHWPEGGDPALAALQWALLTQGALPRIAVALLAGAALGFCGILMQRVLRNPLAEPSTLGVAAGAQFALALAAAYAPAVLDGGRGWVALAGGTAATIGVLALTWRRGLQPVAVVLAGMILSLIFASASAAIVLANGDYMLSLFIWGGGSLTQDGWGAALRIALQLAAAAAAAALLMRPLAVIGLGDAGARSLGVATAAMRLAVLGIAVFLASAVTAEVGVISFVGLAAPALAALSGARTVGARMVAAPLIGAVVLLLSDGIAQALGAAGERLPAGTVTALLGGPLLVWLLPRLRFATWPDTAQPPAVGRLRHPWPVLAGVVVACLAAIGLALIVGRGPQGWSIASGALFHDLLPWRAPRTIVAAAAGAMLAAAGALLQRVTGNPLAGPDILGVGVASGVGLAATLAFVETPSLAIRFAGSAAAAIAAVLLLTAFAARARFGPERLLLAGVAIAAFASAVLSAIIATGSRLAFSLLGWIAGSVNGAEPAHAVFIAVAALMLIAPLAALRHVLAILPLGDGMASGLGLPVGPARALVLVWAGLLSAAATLFAGPLSFVGLIAPHMARLAGFVRPGESLAASVVIGAGLLVMADWLSRIAAFPYQLPLGLFASLIGGPYLIWTLAGGVRRADG